MAADAAASTEAHLVVDAPLAALARTAPMPPGATWRTVNGVGLDAALCGTAAGANGRAALLARAPSRIELDRCRQALGRTPEVAIVGRRAVAVVGRMGDVPIPLDPALIYRALARDVAGANGTMGANGAKQWRDLDPSLPAQPIAVLVPARDSATWRVFASTVLDQGCLTALGTRVPFDGRQRAEACGALRTDAAVKLVESDAERLRALAGAPSGTIAIVPQVALREPGVEATAMPIGGQLPTAAKIAADAYPGSHPVYLAYVVPRGNGAAAAEAPRVLASSLAALVAEASIGPYGAMAGAGLIPIAPAERVALRERLASDLGETP